MGPNTGKHAVAAGLGVLLLVSVYAALFFGPVSLTSGEIHAALTGLDAGADARTMVIVRDLRLGRIMVSILCGAALALAGAVFQGLLRNPLADPFTLGISSGAACGAALALTLGWTGTTTLPMLPLAALLGAFTALALVLSLSRISGGLSRESLILGGIVVSTVLGALLTLIKALNEESVSAIVFWIMGSFQGRSWTQAGLMLPYLLPGALLVLAQARELDLLALGGEQAAQLGVAVNRARIVLVVGAGLLTAAAVSVSGIIGFVGLVVPHLIRLLGGGEARSLLVFSALGGGLLMLWSDTLARSILDHGAELPAGVVTALFGGPFFCLILAGRGRRA